MKYEIIIEYFFKGLILVVLILGCLWLGLNTLRAHYLNEAAKITNEAAKITLERVKTEKDMYVILYVNTDTIKNLYSGKTFFEKDVYMKKQGFEEKP